MGVNWFLEFSTDNGRASCWESQELASDLFWAFNRYLDRHNASAKVVVDIQAELGIQQTIITTEYNCSKIRHLSGIYRVLKYSAMIAKPEIRSHQAEVRIYSTSEEDRDRDISTKIHPARGGGGGGSPRRLVGTDLSTGFVLGMPNPREGDEGLLVSVLRSRPYGELSAAMYAQLHPLESYLCELYSCKSVVGR